MEATKKRKLLEPVLRASASTKLQKPVVKTAGGPTPTKKKLAAKSP